MRLAGALLLAAALTACGGQSQADCPPAGASPAASPNANADPNLAASIPDAVAGQPVQLGTFCVTELGPLGGIETSSEMLDQLGVGLEDVTLAATSASIGTPGGTIYIGAYRYAGASAETLRDSFLRVLQHAADESGVDPELEAVSIGGKQAHRALGAIYYVSDDTLYSVQGDDAKVEEVLEALP